VKTVSHGCKSGYSRWGEANEGSGGESMKRFLTIAVLALLAGSAAAADDVQSMPIATSEILSGYEPTGETVDCINVRQIISIKPISETAFLFKTGVNEYYLNETSGRCARATRMNTRVEYSMPETMLCRTQIIKIIDNGSGMFLGSCSLGSFEKLKKKAPEDLEDA
jgi:hypothetical protein